MFLRAVALSVLPIALLTSSFTDAALSEETEQHRSADESWLVADERSLDDTRVRQQRTITANCLPLLILQNVGGSKTFNRSWVEYKAGFDDGQGNYWLGNEILHQLTVNGKFRLRADVQSVSGSKWYWAEYTTFIVLSESANYKLHVAGFTGNTGFDAMAHINGMMFSTYDRDNDQISGDCANARKGGFWYNACSFYNPVSTGTTYYWHKLPGDKMLKTTRMWLLCP